MGRNEGERVSPVDEVRAPGQGSSTVKVDSRKSRVTNVVARNCEGPGGAATEPIGPVAIAQS